MNDSAIHVSIVNPYLTLDFFFQSKIQNRKSKMDITLIDDMGTTWIRRRCRCCGAVLWEVLGDPVGLCRACKAVRLGPIGIIQFHRDLEYVQRIHRLQYHGACPVDV